MQLIFNFNINCIPWAHSDRHRQWEIQHCTR